MIHEFRTPLLVHTPHGEGEAILLMDYGLNTNTVWVVRLHGGEPKHYFSQIYVSSETRWKGADGMWRYRRIG